MSNLQIVIIEKLGETKTLNVKTFCVDDLYKKCGFKSAVHFQKVFEFSNSQITLQFYGKINGRSCNLNKYNFNLFGENAKIYGNAAIVAITKDSVFTHFNVSMLQTLLENQSDSSDEDYNDENQSDSHHNTIASVDILTSNEAMMNHANDMKNKKNVMEPELFENKYVNLQEYDKLNLATNTTDYQIRSKIRLQMDRLLNNMFSSYNLEVGIYNYVLKEANQNHIVKKWDNLLFRKIYFARVKTIMVNLSPEIIERINNNEIKSEKVAFMTHQELMPEKWKDAIARKIIRDQHKFEVKLEATTDAYTCRKCGSKKCSHYTLQTRSSDEPMTVYISCLDCGKNWKQ